MGGWAAEASRTKRERDERDAGKMGESEGLRQRGRKKQWMEGMEICGIGGLH